MIKESLFHHGHAHNESLSGICSNPISRSIRNARHYHHADENDDSETSVARIREVVLFFLVSLGIWWTKLGTVAEGKWLENARKRASASEVKAYARGKDVFNDSRTIGTAHRYDLFLGQITNLYIQGRAECLSRNGGQAEKRYLHVKRMRVDLYFNSFIFLSIGKRILPISYFLVLLYHIDRSRSCSILKSLYICMINSIIRYHYPTVRILLSW